MTVSPITIQKISQALKAQSIGQTDVIQGLWSGYGELFRAEVIGGEYASVIVKHIKLPQSSQHPRGWATDRSHQRKLRSYQVEVYWYQQYANQSTEHCPMPKCLFVEQSENEVLLVLEDLQTLGFDTVIDQADTHQVQAALRWLAHFHVQHMHQAPIGLWDCGTYWHLDTRPDELAALDDRQLKNAAHRIDTALKQSAFQSLVHGDAKLANFVFSSSSDQVAAVDFQYVGQGCGMKDVVMLLSSTVEPKQCEALCPLFINDYFGYLEQAVAQHNASKPSQTIDFPQLEADWRPLYSVAWADFQRFLKGWSPGHWKVHTYSEALTQQALAQIL